MSVVAIDLLAKIEALMVTLKHAPANAETAAKSCGLTDVRAHSYQLGALETIIRTTVEKVSRIIALHNELESDDDSIALAATCQYCSRASVNDDRECEQCAEETSRGRDYDKRKRAHEARS